MVFDVEPATEEDWATEYLDMVVSVRVVDGVDAAIEHINRYGSHHTDAIVTDIIRDGHWWPGMHSHAQNAVHIGYPVWRPNPPSI